MIWLAPLNPPLLIEWRTRYEDRVNRDFNSSTADRRVDALGRLRFAVPLKSGTQWTGLAQVQVAANPNWVPAGQKGGQNVDSVALFAKYTKNDLSVTVGRQRFAIGSERLVGPLEWQNLSRAFDGVRLQSKTWGLFAGTIGLSANRPRNAKVVFADIDNSIGQTLFVWKHDDVASGLVNIGTLSQTHARKFGKFEFDAEGAIQLGQSQGRRHEAWALHAGLSFAARPKTKAYVEVNSASGGRNADVVRTFDNLYPTNHKFYGSMDMQSWRNMNELAFGVRHKINSKLDTHIHGHLFSLRDARDAWYGAGGPQNGGYVDPSGARGRDVGSEIDMEFNYAVDAKSTLSAGVGIFAPGRFVKSFGTDDKQTWIYVQFTRR